MTLTDLRHQYEEALRAYNSGARLLPLDDDPKDVAKAWPDIQRFAHLRDPAFVHVVKAAKVYDEAKTHGTAAALIWKLANW